MAKGSRQDERVAVIIAAMRENGPMSIPALTSLVGCSTETIRALLLRSSDIFEKVSEKQAIQRGAVPAMYYLVNSSPDMSEDEIDRKTDEMFRSFSWWPEADQVVISAMRAMVKTGEQKWHL